MRKLSPISWLVRAVPDRQLPSTPEPDPSHTIILGSYATAASAGVSDCYTSPEAPSILSHRGSPILVSFPPALLQVSSSARPHTAPSLFISQHPGGGSEEARQLALQPYPKSSTPRPSFHLPLPCLSPASQAEA